MVLASSVFKFDVQLIPEANGRSVIFVRSHFGSSCLACQGGVFKFFAALIGPQAVAPRTQLKSAEVIVVNVK